jgi:hypothetical protein
MLSFSRRTGVPLMVEAEEWWVVCVLKSCFWLIEALESTVHVHGDHSPWSERSVIHLARFLHAHLWLGRVVRALRIHPGADAFRTKQLFLIDFQDP